MWKFVRKQKLVKFNVHFWGPQKSSLWGYLKWQKSKINVSERTSLLYLNRCIWFWNETLMKLETLETFLLIKWELKLLVNHLHMTYTFLLFEVYRFLTLLFFTLDDMQVCWVNEWQLWMYHCHSRIEYYNVYNHYWFPGPRDLRQGYRNFILFFENV